jgi:hypothetical protein
VAGFCRAIGGSDGPYDQRPVQTCLTFADKSPTPVAGTVYFPVRAYAESDLAARDRILAYLDDEHASLYARILAGFAERPLEDGVGMQTYVSLRQYAGPRRVTVYLSPEVYAVQAPGSGREPPAGSRPRLAMGDAHPPRGGTLTVAVDRQLCSGM